MRVTMTGRHMEMSDTLKAHTESRLAKLKSHFDRLIDVDVVLSVEKHRHIAEITVHANGLRIHGEESSEDMYGSIDAVIEKLDKQINRYKSRIKDYKPRKSAQEREFLHNIIHVAESEEGGNGAERGTHRVIEHETIDMKPMSVDEAVMQLELASDKFIVFTNADTNQVNVLYAHDNGTYGLIEPQF
ncbi:MAG TPA: ribosome-associated translation inhibitor RaiA [Candidatus Hydrogenedentes bacterium]|nr:ribosome-associated translation inhibitor RaiA [Candidatus Hydrogenedentota bacterium]HOS02770.1 ribosome-associated translation inhibitor RaiA [Candidatus Hydrogenedentota bacterium]